MQGLLWALKIHRECYRHPRFELNARFLAITGNNGIRDIISFWLGSD